MEPRPAAVVAATGRLAGFLGALGRFAARWDGPSVWFHGDVAPGNLLLDDSGRLGAVIDFGQCGVRDPGPYFITQAHDVLRELATDRR